MCCLARFPSNRPSTMVFPVVPGVFQSFACLAPEYFRLGLTSRRRQGKHRWANHLGPTSSGQANSQLSHRTGVAQRNHLTPTTSLTQPSWFPYHGHSAQPVIPGTGNEARNSPRVLCLAGGECDLQFGDHFPPWPWLKTSVKQGAYSCRWFFFFGAGTPCCGNNRKPTGSTSFWGLPEKGQLKLRDLTHLLPIPLEECPSVRFESCSTSKQAFLAAQRSAQPSHTYLCQESMTFLSSGLRRKPTTTLQCIPSYTHTRAPFVREGHVGLCVCLKIAAHKTGFVPLGFSLQPTPNG